MKLKLLTSGNPKVLKGTSRGWFPLVLHLSPARTSGREVCPARTKFCTVVCLNIAGRGGVGVKQWMTAGELAMVNTIQAARQRRTRLFFDEPGTFEDLLRRDIEYAMDYLERYTVTRVVGGRPVFERIGPGSPKLRLCVRLNGTSDIVWERYIFPSGKSIVDIFPEVIFYDYTKIPDRVTPDNYHLTYSWSEHPLARERSDVYFARGVNTAVVFSTPKGEALPAEWNGRRVIDGDVYDMRFLDPKGVYIGLRAKGWARDPERADGFTIRVEKTNPEVLEVEDFDGGDVFADYDDVFGHISWSTV